MLEHSAFILNVRTRGSDGKTPWERVRGRPFSQRILGFGEIVMYRIPTKAPQEGNMGPRHLQGIFIGYHCTSNSYIIATDDGWVLSRSVTRRPYDNR